MYEPVGMTRSLRRRRNVPFEDPRSVRKTRLSCSEIRACVPGDVAILGEEDVAALAAEHDRFAEQRERGAVDVAADDDGQAAPETGVGRAHDFGPVLERLRAARSPRSAAAPGRCGKCRRDSSASSPAIFEEHAVEALKVTDRDAIRTD